MMLKMLPLSCASGVAKVLWTDRETDWHTLGEIVGSALARSASVLAPRQVRADLPAALPLVEVDAALIERVLINLFDNAAKYTSPESTVLSRAGTSGNSLYLAVIAKSVAID
jgi:two-component system sensor histidine kinase KdpD